MQGNLSKVMDRKRCFLEESSEMLQLFLPPTLSFFFFFCFEDFLLSAHDHLSLLFAITGASLTRALHTSQTSQPSLPCRQILSCK